MHKHITEAQLHHLQAVMHEAKRHYELMKHTAGEHIAHEVYKEAKWIYELESKSKKSS